MEDLNFNVKFQVVQHGNASSSIFGTVLRGQDLQVQYLVSISIGD